MTAFQTVYKPDMFVKAGRCGHRPLHFAFGESTFVGADANISPLIFYFARLFLNNKVKLPA